ncbi:hypothetical protein GFK26_17965 [Variovorax paradoxus]|uniref:Uncharacterized protein n=1 Tax=Variovorax paradoxus TaxID=34073 RepID=A0A5Q0M4Z5_VARPD|nr:hypothetical protein [Variovorax paradoxus]QFZ84516.1 hypothetical protein GFK26_17965 [Variovorax paradoxus]
MESVDCQLVSIEQMADILATSTETKSVSAGELKARWLDTGAETIIVIESLVGPGLKFTGPH